MLKVVIADDHPIVREALKKLAMENKMSVVGEAEDGDEVLDTIEKTECDLLILDISMTGTISGIELIKEIGARNKKSPPILVFSMSNDSKTAIEAMRAGASGYVTKDSNSNLILEAIDKVVKEGKFVCPAITEQIIFGEENEKILTPPHKKLSPREYQVFLLLLDGKSIDAIATELFISRQTVGTHKMRLMKKLSLKSNVDIVRYAINHNLLSC